MKSTSFAAALLASVLIFAHGVRAEDGATTEDVYELILKAASVMEQLGEEGLAAFNDPKGEFVYKDAYVFVINCSNTTMAAHPVKKLVGIDLSNVPDKNPDPAKIKHHTLEICELQKAPNGGWLEYWWTKMGSDEVARKIGFVIGVPGTPYALASTIYDETTDIAKLNASLK